MKRLKLPQIEQETKTNNIIPIINENIKDILSEILNLQNENINSENEENFKELLNKADMIIVECHTTKTFNTGINGNFSRLVYEYQRLNLKYESYKINQQIIYVNEEHKKIKEQQENIKDESNKLVYNILGFIASFSVVSAAISAIDSLESLPQIMLFMAFTTFILLTTLIGLNNFYTKNNKKTKLQDNYFLWKMMVFVIIILIGYTATEYIKNNSEYILECIGRGIGETINITEENKKK